MIRTINKELNKLLGDGFVNDKLYSILTERENNTKIIINLLKIIQGCEIALSFPCDGNGTLICGKNSWQYNGDVEYMLDIIENKSKCNILIIKDINNFKDITKIKDLGIRMNIPIIGTIQYNKHCKSMMNIPLDIKSQFIYISDFILKLIPNIDDKIETNNLLVIKDMINDISKFNEEIQIKL